MKNFTVKTNTAEFVQQFKDALKGRKLGEMLTVERLGNELVVTVSKMGKSVFQYSFNESSDQTIFKMSKEKVALAHRPFRSEIEGKVVKILTKLGAQLS